MSILRARGLVRSFGGGRSARRVVDHAGLDVQRGEMVAVLGRSGSGKSTLLHLLGGLDRPDAGTVHVEDHLLSATGDRSAARMRLRHIGFVFQSFALIEEISAAQNVVLPARLPGAPPGGSARARRLIEQLDLSGVADHRPHELSGGEQQRFAIARALVNDPSVVLADEPTGNLDSASAQTALRLLRQLTDAGRAVVVVTHDENAAAVADRVVHMVDGRLLAGPPAGAVEAVLRVPSALP